MLFVGLQTYRPLVFRLVVLVRLRQVGHQIWQKLLSELLQLALLHAFSQLVLPVSVHFVLIPRSLMYDLSLCYCGVMCLLWPNLFSIYLYLFTLSQNNWWLALFLARYFIWRKNGRCSLKHGSTEWYIDAQCNTKSTEFNIAQFYCIIYIVKGVLCSIVFVLQCSWNLVHIYRLGWFEAIFQQSI